MTIQWSFDAYIILFRRRHIRNGMNDSFDEFNFCRIDSLILCDIETLSHIAVILPWTPYMYNCFQRIKKKSKTSHNLSYYLIFESFSTESTAWNVHQEPTFQDSQLMLMLARNIVSPILSPEWYWCLCWQSQKLHDVRVCHAS